MMPHVEREFDVAISPPSDIVLDVVNAIDPAALLKAREKLSQAAGAAKAVEGGFQIDATIASTKPPAPDAAATSKASLTKFEGFIIQSFIETILPEQAEATFGNGLAGDMWKSMLSEKIAEVVAERGDLGIANRLLGDYAVEGEAVVPLSGVSDVDSLLQQARPDEHANAMLHEKQREFLDLLSGWSNDDDAKGEQS